MTESSYNQRLFSGGWRSRWHLARFHWLNQTLQRLQFEPESVIELGCFDGKTIDFLPQKPKRYVGYDANWENGLDIARQNWKSVPEYAFIECTNPNQIDTEESFDISICMETMEHVPPESVAPYVEKLASVTQKYIFITVPNEKGLPFILKHLSKKMLKMDIQPYTISEFLAASFGKMEKVERDEHKGFDYNELINIIAQHFDNLEITSLPLSWLPAQFSPGICILGHKNML